MKMKEYLKEHFENTDELKDVVKYGCAGGVGGFIYYHETTAFYDKFEADIWDLLEGQAEDLGHNSPLEMIATFQGSKDITDLLRFKNLLCWYAVEETAKTLLEEQGIEI